MKTCTKCKQEKDLSAFYKSKDGKLGCKTACKQCESKSKAKLYDLEKEKLKSRARVYGAANREQGRKRLNAWRRNKHYNVTPDQYSQMLINQEHKCAICYRSVEQLKTELCVDHCHKTNVVRGLLCHG